MKEFQEQLKVLKIFHFVLGGLGIVLSFLPLIYVLMGTIFYSMKDDFPTDTGNPADQLPKIMSVVMMIVGFVGFVFGLAMAILTIVSGMRISTTTHRNFSIIIAAILCVFFPFGTVLGIFTIIVLSKKEVIEIYQERLTEKN